MWTRWSTSCGKRFELAPRSPDCSVSVGWLPGDPAHARRAHVRAGPHPPVIRQHVVPIEDRSGWDEALGGIRHAFAHTWLNCRAMQLTTGWPTFLWVLDDGDSRAILPFAERGAPGALDAVTPYGFGGFASAGADPGVMLEQWRGFATSRGYVC